MSTAITPLVNGGGRFSLSHRLPAAIRALSAFLHAVSACRARAEQRRALRELADHDDPRLLRDIALTRREAYREADKWFWQR